MDELEKNVPDDFWRKAFDEADETPPTRVWDAIERRLDESSAPKVIPLWGLGSASSRPIIWGTGLAAALALLIVGWWAMRTPSAGPSIAHLQPSRSPENVAMAPAVPKHQLAPKSADQLTEERFSTNTFSKRAQRSAITSARQVPAPTQSIDKLSNLATQQTMAAADHKPSSLPTQPTAEAMSPGVSAPAMTDGALGAADRMAVRSSMSDRMTVSGDVQTDQNETWIVEQLTGKPIRMRSQAPIQRIVWFQPAELPLEPEFTKEQRKKREMWTSVSAMPNSFNPIISVRSAQTALNYAVTSARNTNQGAVSSQADFSMAYQAGAGIQLDERWSIESGVGYLVGHSTVEAPTQSVSYGLISTANLDRNIAVSNQYIDALRSSSKALSNAAPVSHDVLSTSNAYLIQNSYTSQAQQTLTNDYQYLQVPVQVGYQLRPRKRLSLAVLGGLLTNIFVRNTVGSDVVISAKDGVYRPVSLAATMGARFRYRPSGHWSASLAGMYQPSLGFGTQTESQVQSQPTSTGMSFGVDYHF